MCTATITSAPDGEYALTITDASGQVLVSDLYERGEDPADALADHGYETIASWTEQPGQMCATVRRVDA